MYRNIANARGKLLGMWAYMFALLCTCVSVWSTRACALHYCNYKCELKCYNVRAYLTMAHIGIQTLVILYLVQALRYSTHGF